MADSVRQKLQEIRDILLSKSPHRYEYAAELASDLHTLCTEQVTEADLGRYTELTLVCTQLLFVASLDLSTSSDALPFSTRSLSPSFVPSSFLPCPPLSTSLPPFSSLPHFSPVFPSLPPSLPFTLFHP